MHKCLPMGCLPSRSTAVSPVEQAKNSRTNDGLSSGRARSQQTNKTPVVSQNGQAAKRIVANGHNLERDSRSTNGVSQGAEQRQQMESPKDRAVNKVSSSDSINEAAEDEIMSILMNEEDQDKLSTGSADDQDGQPKSNNSETAEQRRVDDEPSGQDEQQLESAKTSSPPATSDADDAVAATVNNALVPVDNQQLQLNQQRRSIADENSTSFDEELNADLLRQYIIVDFEITQLEDKDALRIYHEKIEQLEQLERELDMISTEAEEVAARSETNTQMGFQSPSDFGKAMATDAESNSLLSGATESMSPRSSFRRTNNNTGQQQLQIDGASGKSRQQQQKRGNSQTRQLSMFKQSGNVMTSGSNSIANGTSSNNNNNDSANNNNYSTVEEVFNRKIILEKERDKLKKEVEMVIIECDKLQNRYKRRDEILDKLFDGRTGNGLENHLEQQLNWLMEQKHYVDQVFYAWKRAETLTSQTCEQFASALELLKRMSMVQDDAQRAELTKSIGQLLIKSRQDMEQAQRYNPNVDAPFFTDTETERFDKIIETISSRSINQGDYGQIATVIQFAHKRAVSIRLWLEQILQITIARDSFELAEEYKWIAIQLRKERITLIKSKLQDPPYRSMAQAIQEQLIKQQQQQLSITNTDSANNTLRANSQRAKSNQPGNQLQLKQNQPTNEVNRDSGIESDDIDIEEEIYRLLEMNKTRLEAAMAANGGTHQADPNNANYQLKPMASGQMQSVSAKGSMNDQEMRERIERRVRGERQLASTNGVQPVELEGKQVNGSIGTANSQMSASSTMTPSKLRVELDEESRQKLLRQVDQTHEKHRSRMESLRGNNKAKASDSIMNRMQQARKYQEASQTKADNG